MAHEPGYINWKDIHFQNMPGSYSKFKAYSQSKLANVMHAAELARRVEDFGIRTYSLHPGKSQNLSSLKIGRRPPNHNILQH